MVLIELPTQLIQCDSSSHRKRSDVILSACSFRSDIIGQCQVGLALRFFRLLPQRMDDRQRARAGRIAIELNIVPDPRRCKEPVDTLGPQQAFLDNALEQLLRVIEQLLGPDPDRGILKNRGIASIEFPGVKKWRPVDERDQLFKRLIADYTGPQKRRHGNIERCPVTNETSRASLLKR